MSGLCLGTSSKRLCRYSSREAEPPIRIPTCLLLSDPDLSVSHTYTPNQYGMMGDHMNGHSFILVGADGKIVWRADYGSAPDYTMYVPIPNLIADIRQGLNSTHPNAMIILLLTQANCHFCDIAKGILDRLSVTYHFSVETIDLNTLEEQAIALQAGVLFPPRILIDGKSFSYGRPSEKKLRRELEGYTKSIA